MITDHPYLDRYGPVYSFSVCDHSNCTSDHQSHKCYRQWCGRFVEEHETMLRARSVRDRRWKVVRVDGKS